jgi:hypothetical protein
VPAALAAALAAAALFLYTRGGDLSFYVDEWGFMLHRRGHDLSVFLEPQNGHLLAIPILLYKSLFAVFGVGSYVPYRLVALAIELTCAALLFVLVRRRVGDAIALAVAVTVLFLGPAWEPLLAPVGMVSITSLAAGLGMLLALDAGSRRGDVAACVLLVVSLASFSYGPAFAAAAAVDVLLRPGARRRIWLVVLPVALYALWAIGYGDDSQIVWANIPDVPRAVADSIGADLVSLTGLYRLPGVVGGPVFDATYAAALALAFIALVGFQLRTPARRAPRLFALVVLAVAFWVSIALVLNSGRTVTSSRYIYPGVVMVLLLGAEMARGRRLGTRGLVALAIATGVLLVVNVYNLRGAANPLNEIGRFDRAELTALELARGTAPPNFKPEAAPQPAPGHYLGRVSARAYYDAVDSFGSPAYTLAQLRRAPSGPRAAADQVLAAATALAARPATAPTGAASLCRELRPTVPGSGQAEVTVPPGGLFLRGAQRDPLTVRLRRFGDDFGALAVGVPPLPGNAGTAIPIHRDAAAVAWRAQVSGIRGPVRVCGLG